MTNNPTRNLRAVLIAAAVAMLATAASPSFAAPAGMHGGATSAHHGAGHPGVGHAARHVIAASRGFRNAGWGLWGYGPMVYGAPQTPAVEPAASGALTEHVTYTYDVPWDAVHRYPPALRTYEFAQGCHEQHQTVARSGGGKQTVNIIRCY